MTVLRCRWRPYDEVNSKYDGHISDGLYLLADMDLLQVEGGRWWEDGERGEDTRGGGAAANLLPADFLHLRVERTVLLHNGNYELGGEEGKPEAGNGEENHGDDVIHR